MGDELTQAAKDAIADAVRIVREDKWDKFLRGKVTNLSGTPPTDPPKPKEGDPPVDPPKPKEGDPPNPPADDEKRKSAYWGVFEE
jgi:hypothetical protein